MIRIVPCPLRPALPILACAISAVIPVATTANPSPEIALGRQVYAAQCASCHGVNLEGQPNWREPGPNGRLPAPPHDVSGHTWHHPDAQLLAIIRDGTAALVGNGYQSDMPGFAGKLTEAEMRAVLAFIKSTWPDRAAEYQRQVSGE
ncbi:cytochrome c [Cereibacter sphaeroides]|uniref:c-type cytochrome n=1 Tax=Cereibacter sphaeroides TaxID=1063 RepID=UPI001F37F8C9|nr:cytochrome c [Cereibacter sphaeroides]MCE6951454.1 cytochrome c [Cereibacter sphaeroides]